MCTFSRITERIISELPPHHLYRSLLGAFVEFCAFALLYQPCPGDNIDYCSDRCKVYKSAAVTCRSATAAKSHSTRVGMPSCNCKSACSGARCACATSGAMCDAGCSCSATVCHNRVSGRAGCARVCGPCRVCVRMHVCNRVSVFCVCVLCLFLCLYARARVCFPVYCHVYCHLVINAFLWRAAFTLTAMRQGRSNKSRGGGGGGGGGSGGGGGGRGHGKQSGGDDVPKEEDRLQVRSPIACLHFTVALHGSSSWVFLGSELFGKTIGIIGTGNIGMATANLFRAFGCKIIAHSRSERKEAIDAGIRYVSLETLLSHSDIVSIHTPLNEMTSHLIGSNEIALMKPTAILINAARGSIVDYGAVANALNKNLLGGAGIDVYESEPPIAANHALMGCPNIMLLPHIGYATKEAIEKRANVSLQNILQWIAGTPENIVGSID